MLSVSIVFSPVLSLAQSTIPPAGTKYDANGDIIYSSAPVVATTTDAIYSKK